MKSIHLTVVYFSLKDLWPVYCTQTRLFLMSCRLPVRRNLVEVGVLKKCPVVVARMERMSSHVRRSLLNMKSILGSGFTYKNYCTWDPESLKATKHQGWQDREGGQQKPSGNRSGANRKCKMKSVYRSLLLSSGPQPVPAGFCGARFTVMVIGGAAALQASAHFVQILVRVNTFCSRPSVRAQICMRAGTPGWKSDERNRDKGGRAAFFSVFVDN